MSPTADDARPDELLDDDTLRELERLSLPAIRSVTASLAGERPGPATGPRADFADLRPRLRTTLEFADRGKCSY